MGLETMWKFEHELTPGAKVEARWTNSHHYYRAPAEVVRVNKASVRVKLTRPVMFGAAEMYPAGRELVMPRGFNFSSGTAKWSSNNGVFPVPAIEGTAAVLQ